MSSTVLLTMIEFLFCTVGQLFAPAPQILCCMSQVGLFWSWTPQTVPGGKGVTIFRTTSLWSESTGDTGPGLRCSSGTWDGKAGTHWKISYKSTYVIGLLPQKESYHLHIIWGQDRLYSIWSPALPKMKTWFCWKHIFQPCFCHCPEILILQEDQ